MNSTMMNAVDILIEKFVLDEYGNEYVVDRDFASNVYRVTNKTTGRYVCIDRYQLENSVSPMGMVKRLVDHLHDSVALPDRHSGGGVVYVAPSHAKISGSEPGLIYTDEMNMTPDDLRKKLFNENEIAMISKIKKQLRWYLQSECPHKTFDWSRIVVAGGYFASVINDEVINDIDLFLLRDFHNKGIIEKDMWEVKNAPAASHMFKIGDMSYMKNDKIKGTLQDHRNKIQYIITQYDTREELVKHFDFKHCCVSYDYHNDKLYITRETFDLIKQKRLVPNPTAANQPEMWRYNKFWNKGWKSEIQFKESA
jgi:hypothetical protein